MEKHERRKGRKGGGRPKNITPIRCVGKSKAASDFRPLLLTSTLTKVHDGPIWCTAFNKDGVFFATGGRDGVVQIWNVSPPAATQQTDMTTNASEESTPTPAKGIEIILLSPAPHQRFTDHSKDVVDISWSHTDFLLSASLDKTVRLYHPTKTTCLKHFRHKDMLTVVSFHPTDDRYFLTGGFDNKIRIWSIPDGRVRHCVPTTNIVTAAEYQPDGQLVVVGLVDGKVIFFHVTMENGSRVQLKYHTQIICKNRKAKVGKKVTGLAFMSQKKREGGKDKVYEVCVTTNDSRVRLVGLNDFRIVRKYKGVTNSSLQIKSHISESGEFIACGSETRFCTIWNTTTTKQNSSFHHVKNVTDFHRYDKVNRYEKFEVTKKTANPYAVTDSIFVPGKSMRRGLVSSGLFPSLTDRQRIHHDLSSAAIITSDYEGTIRVFIRSSCIDDVAKMF